MVGADTRRHDAHDKSDAGQGKKYHLFNDRVVIAKAGFGPSADILWGILEGEVPKDADAAIVAKALEEFGQFVYDNCVKLHGPVSTLDLIVAGVTAAGPSLHWQQHHLKSFGASVEPASVIAFGTLDDSKDAAVAKLQKLCSSADGKITANLGLWCQNVVSAEMSANPHAVGYPAHIALLRNDQLPLENELVEDSPADDRFKVTIL